MKWKRVLNFFIFYFTLISELEEELLYCDLYGDMSNTNIFVAKKRL